MAFGDGPGERDEGAGDLDAVELLVEGGELGETSAQLSEGDPPKSLRLGERRVGFNVDQRCCDHSPGGIPQPLRGGRCGLGDDEWHECRGVNVDDHPRWRETRSETVCFARMR